MNLLLKNLKEKTNRNAQFKTVIALHLNGELKTFTGICKGEITMEESGEKGFGYDPIFIPNGHKQTFAEMELTLKNSIGHRGKAVNKLVSVLNDMNVK
jgi:XTP/dITP diphosphohydrolase